MIEQLVIDNLIEVEQPIGKYYIAKVNAKDLLKISCSDERKFNEELEEYLGTQRELNKSKINSLKEYIKTSDATFPNTIIGTLVGDNYSVMRENDKIKKIIVNIDTENEYERPFRIIDGQHRLYSFKDEDIEKFDLLVAIFVDASINDQAYIFSVINTTQTKLNPSLLQDLTALSKVTTPEQVVNAITRKFNNEEGPLYKKIKMLGKKDKTSPEGILSQYTFSKPIINYIYNPKDAKKLRELLIQNGNNRKSLPNNLYGKRIFWKYYNNIEQKQIYLMLLAYFTAMREIFKDEWGNEKYILCKTTGYTAFMNLFSDFYNQAKGNSECLINKNYYYSVFGNIKEKVDFSEDAFRLGEMGARNLYNTIKEIFDYSE